MKRQLALSLIPHILSISITEQYKSFNLTPLSLTEAAGIQLPHFTHKEAIKDKPSYSWPIYWLSHANHALSGLISRFVRLVDECAGNSNVSHFWGTVYDVLYYILYSPLYWGMLLWKNVNQTNLICFLQVSAVKCASQMTHKLIIRQNKHGPT